MDVLVNTTPELFETILDHLPFLDLIIASGVNHSFRHFITKSSRKLRRKLFLLSTEAKDNNTPSEIQKDADIDKWGVIGRHLQCQDILFQPPKQRSVNIFPYLLNRSSHILRAAHLSHRAVRAKAWPDVFLTNPPCAHAVVSFTYSCTVKRGKLITLEAMRSLFRKKGVTLAAVEEALSQKGGVRFKESGKPRQHVTMDTTLYEQIEKWEARFRRVMVLDRKQSFIKLHGDPVPTVEERIVRFD